MIYIIIAIIADFIVGLVIGLILGMYQSFKKIVKRELYIINFIENI